MMGVGELRLEGVGEGEGEGRREERGEWERRGRGWANLFLSCEIHVYMSGLCLHCVLT